MKRSILLVAMFSVAAFGFGVAQAVSTSTSVRGNNLSCSLNGAARGNCPTSLAVPDGQTLTAVAAANPTTTTTSSTTTTSFTNTSISTTSSSTSTGPVGRWQPPQRLRWYWQLSSVPTTPKANIDATDFDGFDGTASNVAAYHAAGQKAICYIDAGTFEPGRADSSQFPASLKGNGVSGWQGEYWLDVRPSGPNYSTLKSIMLARYQMCKNKGFDAVEPDNVDSWDGNNPGFSTTSADQLAYNEWTANTVHSLGMAVFQKNDPNQASALVGYYDGVMSEQAYQYGDDYSAYEAAGKPHLDAEYSSQSCHAPPTVMQARFDLNLNGGTFAPCW